MAVKPQGVSHAEFNNNPGNIKAYNPDGSLNSWGRYLQSKGYKFTKGSEGEKGEGFFAKYESKEDGLKATMSFWNEAKDWESYKGLTLNQALEKYSGKGVKGNDGVVQTGYTVDSLGIKGLDGNKLLSEYTDKELNVVMANQLKTEGPKSFKSLVDDGLIKENDLKISSNVVSAPTEEEAAKDPRYARESTPRLDETKDFIKQWKEIQGSERVDKERALRELAETHPGFKYTVPDYVKGKTKGHTGGLFPKFFTEGYTDKNVRLLRYHSLNDVDKWINESEPAILKQADAADQISIGVKPNLVLKGVSNNLFVGKDEKNNVPATDKSLSPTPALTDNNEVVDFVKLPESEESSLLDLKEGVTDQERQDALDKHNNRLKGLMDEFSGDASTDSGTGTDSDTGTDSFADAMGEDDDVFKETFLDKIGGVSSLIGLATGVVGLGQALKEVDIPKDPKLGPAFQQRLEESKRMAQQGLTPSELAKAHNELDSSYATGIENIVRGSAGNRAQFMAGLGGLDVARQSALMDIAVADAQMQRQNQEKYDGMMMMNEQYEAARTSKYNNAKFEQDMMNKQAGAALAGSALSMVTESIGDRKLNQLRKMQTQKMMRDMGYVPDSKGKSGQDKLGTDKDGNNLLEDINSLTSDGSQRTGLIEGIKNKFNIKKEQKNNDPISLPSINYTAPTNTGLINTRDQLNKNLQESEKSLADQLKKQQLYNQQSFQTFDPWLNLK